jgi:hypothetical protein
MDTKFNINNFVKVKLTQKGIDILKRNHDDLNKRCNGVLDEFELKLDEDGYYKDQLWSIMQSFGEHMYLGVCEPFETEIICCNGEQI